MGELEDRKAEDEETSELREKLAEAKKTIETQEELIKTLKGYLRKFGYENGELG